MKTAFVINYLAAIFGINACVTILEHTVHPPVVRNCSSATFTCRVDVGLPDVEVWWRFKGENASKLPDATIVPNNMNTGEWQLQIACATSRHQGPYTCNAREIDENQTVSSKELVLQIYNTDAPEVEFTDETTFENASSVTLHWRVKNDGNLPVKGFHLYKESAVDESYVDIDSDTLGNATEYTIHGLLPGLTYTFKLAAYNEDGQSEFAYRNISTSADVAPEVSWVHTLASTNETLLFGWRRPDHENGAKLTHYDVQLHFQNGSLLVEKTMDIHSSGRKNHMYIFVNLEPVETYIFKVRACNDLGCGQWSRSLNATTSDGVPDPPRNVLLTCDRDFERDAETIKITWDPPVNARGTIVAYNVTRFTSVPFLDKNNQTVEDKATKTDIIDADKHSMEYTAVFLANTEISVAICTINRSGCGPMTNITVNTQCRSPSNACNAILEHIVEPSVANNCSAATLICRVDNSVPNLEVWWTFKGENALKLPDTAIGTDNADNGEWQLHLKCPTEKHKGTYICNAQGRNGSEKVCRKKAVLKIYEAPILEFTNETTVEDPNTVTLRWRVVNDGNLPVTKFKLYRYNSVDAKSVEVDDILGNATKHTIKTLLPGSAYSFKLAAFNEAGESDPVYWNITMPAPLKVSRAKAYFPSDKTLIFAWYPPSFDNGSNITHYNIQLLHPNGSLVSDKTVIETLHQFENLEPAKTYTFQVQACDVISCGEWSDPIKGRTTDN